MKELVIHLKDKNWVADWMGRFHHIRLSNVDDLEFVTSGLVNQPPVRFSITAHGEILSVVDNRTNHPATELRIPATHSLYRDLNIGKPYKEP